jgi:hypothetical protein
MRSVVMYLLMLIGVFCTTADTHAAKNDWAEGIGGSDGATKIYYNGAAYLKWSHPMGDWVDANGVAQGPTAYATASVVDDDRVKPVELNVTRLVQEWLSGTSQNQGFFLRATRGNIVFCSRQYGVRAQRPILRVENNGHLSGFFSPEADTVLSPSTTSSQGQATELRVTGGSAPVHSLLRFDLSRLRRLAATAKVTLRLYTLRQYGAGSIGVFRCQQGSVEVAGPPILGLAASYVNDEGIGQDPAVLFATGFESENWPSEWTNCVLRHNTTITEDPERLFEPLTGKALSVLMPEGKTTAMNAYYEFAKEAQDELEELYFRYYLRLGNDWNQTLQSGKLPGLSGTYDRAGWGGRKSNGTNGWSARGLFMMTIPADNPLGNTTPIGTYAYYTDMPDSYGDCWVWDKGYYGYLENNRWYSIEQYVKLNTPDEKNGILRAWIDGHLAFERTNISFRLNDTLKIQRVWMDVYHGGTLPSPYDQHLFIDNVVVATKYIGPMVQP